MISESTLKRFIQKFHTGESMAVALWQQKIGVGKPEKSKDKILFHLAQDYLQVHLAEGNQRQTDTFRFTVKLDCNCFKTNGNPIL